MARPSAPLAMASRTSVSRSRPGLSSIGVMPRLRACSGRLNRVAFPPPERGLWKRTGCWGGGTRCRSPRTRNAARAAASESHSATTTTSAASQSPTTRIHTAPAISPPAAAIPAARAMPWRTAPYQAAPSASARQATTTRPRGNSSTVATTVTTMASAARMSAASAARRLAAVTSPGQLDLELRLVVLDLELDLQRDLVGDVHLDARPVTLELDVVVTREVVRERVQAPRRLLARDPL